MEGGRVVQVGTPEEILQNPADDYVRAFFRGVDPTNVISAGDIAVKTNPTIIKTKKGGIRAALEQLNAKDYNHGYVLNAKKQFLGTVSVDSLSNAIDKGQAGEPIDVCFLPEVKAASTDDNMQDILKDVAEKPWPVPVIDDTGKYLGVVSKNRFLKTLHKSDNGNGQADTVEA